MSKPSISAHQAAIEDRLGSLRTEAGRLEQVARGLQQSLQPPETETLSAENAALRAELHNISSALQQQQHVGQEQLEFLRSQLRLRESENEVLRKRMISSSMQNTVSNVDQISTQQSLPFLEAPGYLNGYSSDIGNRSNERFDVEPILAHERFNADQARNAFHTSFASNHGTAARESDRQHGVPPGLPTELRTKDSLPPVTPVPPLLWHGHSGIGTSAITGVAQQVPSAPWAVGPASLLSPRVQPIHQGVEPIAENAKPFPNGYEGYAQYLSQPKQFLPEEGYESILPSKTLNGSLLAEMLGPARLEWLESQKKAQAG
eukprot:gnl/MRDRNA2_/MRDRNA2_35818_c0_seq1.p1 gnl/MRDRNA2_/MRDRNA2_35818_c0~~gnl/MRDRNA2_/MRDRNA2_35818_c0_seq1.p1  ORF type:complete len:374 (-),score=62.35 gnl/MRDRNA2_/MRDRNA2_35818_c0_seq1:10-963(-)